MTVIFRCLDLETTGMTPEHEVIEIAWTDLGFDPATRATEILGRHERLYRPTKPMTSDVLAVHHLTEFILQDFEPCTPDDLADAAQVGEGNFLVAAFCEFERQWIPTPDGVRWLCTVKVASRVMPDAPSHSNQAVRYELGLDLDPALAMPPHRAGPDSYVTACILAEFLKTERVSHMVHWTNEPKWMARCPIGKHKGAAWSDVPHDFLVWMTSKAEFMDPDAKHWAVAELQRRREINA